MLKLFLKYLPWIIFSLFAYYLVANNFHAKLSMIDDHEVAVFLGSDGKINISEIPSIVMSTEVGKWGVETRYRPVYYTFRVLETALWRNNATLWYLFRYLILVVSMVLGWQILQRYFPKVVSYLFIFYVMTMPFWPDILTRLGPSEIYALPGLLLFIYGMITNKLWMVSLGYIICVGSKENFLILFPILITWVFYQWKKMSKKDFIALALMSGFTLFILGGIVVATDKSGVDFYLNDISYSKRLLLTLESIPTIISSRHLLIPLVLFGIMSISLQKKYFLLGLSILLVTLSQYVFYNNKLPLNSRYDFPALLLFPVFDLLVVKMMIERTKAFKWGKYFKILCYLGLSLFMIAFVIRRGYILIHQTGLKNRVESIEFDKNLRQAAGNAKQKPDAVLVFVSTHFVDFEPIVSVSRYLTAMEVKNSMMIHHTREINLDNILGLQLEDRMSASMNDESQVDNLFQRFSPINELSEPCYSITFHDALPLPQCPEIAKF